MPGSMPSSFNNPVQFGGGHWTSAGQQMGGSFLIHPSTHLNQAIFTHHLLLRLLRLLRLPLPLSLSLL